MTKQPRKKLIVANWKMHFNTHQASLYLHTLSEQITPRRHVEVVLCPNFLVLQSLSLQINRRQFKLGAQNCYWRDEGPFTGEVSATMLHGTADYVIVGHSERRHHFHEHDRDIRHKVQAALRNKLRPILCIGETADERAAAETVHVLHDHLMNGLANVTAEEVSRMVIAYEPVWAIGSGDNARPDDVTAAIETIRSQVKHVFGTSASQDVAVLYGGSVSSETAGHYLALPGCDGLLVGGASLIAEEFAHITEIAYNTTKDERGGE